MLERCLHWFSAALHAQTFEAADLAVVALLVLLEGVLSIDNAIVLGLQVRRLPDHLHRKALTYGLAGALFFRLVAIGFAAWLLQSRIVKLLGGAYLVYLSVKHLIRAHRSARPNPQPNPLSATPLPADARPPGFWPTVLAVELTDIAFAIDSILAAIAMVSGSAAQDAQHPPAPAPLTTQAHPKLWVIVAGGMIGVVLMRFAAALFIRLIDRFPRFESAAYLMVLIVGAKMLFEWTSDYLPSWHIDFHDAHALAFWLYWGLMLLAVGSGFLKAPTPAEKAKHRLS